MDRAKSSFIREGGMKMLLGGGGGDFVCVLRGFEKSVRSRRGRKIWLKN